MGVERLQLVEELVAEPCQVGYPLIHLLQEAVLVLLKEPLISLVIEIEGTQKVWMDQPQDHQELEELVDERPIADDHEDILPVQEVIGEGHDEALGLPEHGIDDPVCEPLDQGLLVFLDLKHLQALLYRVED